MSLGGCNLPHHVRAHRPQFGHEPVPLLAGGFVGTLFARTVKAVAVGVMLTKGGVWFLGDAGVTDFHKVLLRKKIFTSEPYSRDITAWTDANGFDGGLAVSYLSFACWYRRTYGASDWVFEVDIVVHAKW
jgi:hypothetical protein